MPQHIHRAVELHVARTNSYNTFSIKTVKHNIKWSFQITTEPDRKKNVNNFDVQSLNF